MARARNLKPGFFSNDLLAECQPLARLLFQGLWCHADRAGRLEDRPRKFKAEILPYDECDAEVLLSELVLAGFIVRYQVDGKRYVQVVNFGKHQNPHIKEPDSTIPAPCEHQTSTGQAPDSHHTSPADSLNPIPLTLNPSNTLPGKPALSEFPVEFEIAWQEYPKRTGASKADSLKAWKARLKTGADPQEIIAGVRRYAAYCATTNTEPQYIKQPATFFGPGEHYLSDWTAPPSRASPAQTRDEGRRQVLEVLTGAGRNEHRNERDITGEAIRLAG
jgi:hypothetical protein